MVAPFWADSDIQNYGTQGHVWKKTISSNVFAVAWDHVGYYRENSDKKNTFMVMISDGNDPSMGIGNNVCFCYEDMQWTTGDYSFGVEGFGGVPATVGVNAGNGTDYFQIGRFDSPGAGETGIDILDGLSVCFPITGLDNIHPIAIGVPTNSTIDLECDESISDLVITFSGPEGYQTVSLDTESGDSSDPTVDIEDGVQTAKATINWAPSDAASVNITISATDNLLATTIVTLTLTYPGSCKEEPSSQPSSGKCILPIVPFIYDLLSHIMISFLQFPLSSKSNCKP